MSKEKIPKLSGANYEIMKEIWGRAEVTIKEVHEAITSKRGKQVTNSTVKMQMLRLVKYGWLKRRKEGRLIYYSAVHPQERAVEGLFKDLKMRLFNGSNLKLVKHLFNTKDISKEEIDSLRKMLDEYEEREG